MSKNNFVLTSISYVILIFFLFTSCDHSYDYDHIDVGCKSEIIEGQDQKELDEIKAYLSSIGNHTSYYKDNDHSIYYRLITTNARLGFNKFRKDNNLKMFGVYEIEYEAYLMDGTKTKKETLFDRGKKKIQPYLGIYNRILPRFGIALSKIPIRAPGTRMTLDFYLTSNGAFSVCGWPYSPFGVQVQPNSPVHFIVTVTF